MEKIQEKYKNKDKLNILKKSYKYNLDPKLESTTNFLDFIAYQDEFIEFELFYLSDNSFIYHNKTKDLTKNFNGIELNELINFIYNTNLHSIFLLFKKGDLFIIPIIYLESKIKLS